VLGIDTTPRPQEGRGKFAKEGLFRRETLLDMGLSAEAAESIAEMGNFGLASSTWSNYRTAEKMMKLWGRETDSDTSMPWTQKQTLQFINWMVSSRQAKHGTITNYLAGIRQVHIMAGHEDVKLRTELVNLVLTGIRNKQLVGARQEGKKGRLPVTISVMKLIKAALRKAEYEVQKKLLIWAVCCIAFNGGFRIHELLSREEECFDPKFTLLGEDIKIAKDMEEDKEVLLISIKWPKEDKKGSGVELEVFETGTEICPVRAWKKWKKSSNISGKEQDRLPAFRLESGKSLTGRSFNKELKLLLEKHIDYSQGTISSHSFRSGITTTLGQAGHTDNQLKTVGRWSSRAFEHYVKLPRTSRKQMAREIGRL